MANCNALVWVGRSLRDFKEFPAAVREELNLSRREVQQGRHPAGGKPLKGFGGGSVLELSVGAREGAFRVVYAVKFRDRVCVLHCFQKKSSSGIKTSQQDMDIIKQRLRVAEKEYGK